MGLLEKAMQYKRELNRKGEQTLIDRIKGPADTEMDGDDALPDIPDADGDMPVSDPAGGSDDIVLLTESDLVEVPDEGPAPDSSDAALPPEPPVVDEDWIEKELLSSHDAPVSGVRDAAEDSEPGIPGADDQGPPSAARREVPPPYEGSFRDYLVLYETGKEIIRAGSEQELFDTLIFLIMGQIGVSSVSIMVQDREMQKQWVIAESRGVSIEESFSFNCDGGILGECDDRRDIVDIENFSHNEKFKEDYLNFISIDARLLVPMVYQENLVGIIVIGNKISNEEFTDEDKDYLYSVSQFAGATHYMLFNKIHVQKELDSLRREISGQVDLNRVRDDVFSRDSMEEVKGIVQKEMEKIGVGMYAFFIMNEFNNRYIPLFTEEKDFLNITENKLSIDVKNGLVQFIARAKGPVEIDDFKSFDAVFEIFTKTQINRMTIFRLYPFRLGDNCVGFLVVFQLSDPSRPEDCDGNLNKIAEILYPYIISFENVRYTKRKYIDTVEQVLNRIEEELRKAERLGIPLTLVEMSIKNFKRYYTLFGIKKSQELMGNIESLVKTKLSDVDFSIRHDRNRILIVLPGKNRDFAIPLSNALRNEIIHAFSGKDLHLLVTFLAAEYPRDGEDVYSLIDSIE